MPHAERGRKKGGTETHLPRSGLQHTAHRFPSTSPACARGTSTACVCARKHTSYTSIASAVVNAPPGAAGSATSASYCESASDAESEPVRARAAGDAGAEEALVRRVCEEDREEDVLGVEEAGEVEEETCRGYFVDHLPFWRN